MKDRLKPESTDKDLRNVVSTNNHRPFRYFRLAPNGAPRRRCTVDCRVCGRPRQSPTWEDLSRLDSPLYILSRGFGLKSVPRFMLVILQTVLAQ